MANTREIKYRVVGRARYEDHTSMWLQNSHPNFVRMDYNIPNFNVKSGDIITFVLEDGEPLLTTVEIEGYQGLHTKILTNNCQSFTISRKKQ